MMTEIEYNRCSPYTTEDLGQHCPCTCPVCGGFLPGDFPIDGTEFTCKKCGSELLTIEVSEKLKDSDNWQGEEGRICVALRRENHKGKHSSIKLIHQVKEGRKAWKAFL